MEIAKQDTKFVYVLKEVGTEGPVYVGCCLDPEARKRLHFGYGRLGKQTKVYRWLSRMFRLDRQVEMVLMEEVPMHRWRDAERRWHDKYKDQGTELLNM